MQIVPDWNKTYNTLIEASKDIGFIVMVGWNYVGGDTMLVIEFGDPEVTWYRGVHVYVWNDRDARAELIAALALPVYHT